MSSRVPSEYEMNAFLGGNVNMPVPSKYKDDVVNLLAALMLQEEQHTEHEEKKESAPPGQEEPKDQGENYEV